MYKEVGDGQIKDILSLVVNDKGGTFSGLLLFREAVEHIVRLCRTLVSCKI